MIDVKFLAWHKADKKLYSVQGFSIDKWFLRGKTYPMPKSAIHLMQYIGIKDKNGVEIYNGYIVELKLVDGNERFKVCYDAEQLKYTLIDRNGDAWGFTTKNEIEVIGDIYTNPELLYIQGNE